MPASGPLPAQLRPVEVVAKGKSMSVHLHQLGVTARERSMVYAERKGERVACSCMAEEEGST